MFENEERYVEVEEDLAFTDDDPFFNKSYQKPQPKYCAELAERAVTLKQKFVNNVLLNNCSNCAYHAMLGIARELSRKPALMEYVPAYKFAELMEVHLFYKMLNAAKEDNTFFLYAYHQGYVNLWNTASKARCAYFATVEYIDAAKTCKQPLAYVTDLELLTDHLGSAGLHIYTIATGRNTMKISAAFDSLRQRDELDKELSYSLLKDELLNNCLYELNAHSLASGNLPKYLHLKVLLLKLLLDAKTPQEQQRFFDAVLPKQLVG